MTSSSWSNLHRRRAAR